MQFKVSSKKNPKIWIVEREKLVRLVPRFCWGFLSIGATIRIGREIQSLQYAGFFLSSKHLITCIINLKSKEIVMLGLAYINWWYLKRFLVGKQNNNKIGMHHLAALPGPLLPTV